MFQSLPSHICAQTNTYVLHIKLHRVCKLNIHFLGYSQPRNSSHTVGQLHVNLSVSLYYTSIWQQFMCAQMYSVLSTVVYSILDHKHQKWSLQSLHTVSVRAEFQVFCLSFLFIGCSPLIHVCTNYHR